MLQVWPSRDLGSEDGALERVKDSVSYACTLKQFNVSREVKHVLWLPLNEAILRDVNRQRRKNALPTLDVTPKKPDHSFL